MNRFTTASSVLIALSLIAGCKKDSESSAKPRASAPVPSSRPAFDVSAKGPTTADPLPETKVLFSKQDRNPPIAIRVVGDQVYWANAGTDADKQLARGKGQIMRGSTEGGEPSVIADGQNLPDSIAVAGDTVYWTCEYDVFHAPAAGGKPTLLVEGNEKLGSPMSLVVRGDHVAIAFSHPSGGGLHIVDKSGKAARTPFGVSGGISVAALSDDAAFAYSRRQLAIGRIPLAGGQPKTLAAKVKGCGGMATDGQTLYWTEPGDGRVRALPVGGGDAVTVSEGYRRPWALAIDGDDLVLCDREAGTIVHIPKKGGRGVIVAKNQGKPLDVAVGGGFAYWVSPERGTISQVKLP